jgi:hypothetical protein
LLEHQGRARHRLERSSPESDGDRIVEQQVASLERWVEKRIWTRASSAPLRPYLEAITTVRDQDLEQTKDAGVRVRQGVAVDRRISIKTPRHGRRPIEAIDGYKEHVGYDLDIHAILACAVTP